LTIASLAPSVKPQSRSGVAVEVRVPCAKLVSERLPGSEAESVHRSMLEGAMATLLDGGPNATEVMDLMPIKPWRKVTRRHGGVSLRASLAPRETVPGNRLMGRISFAHGCGRSGAHGAHDISLLRL
jgi:hypothetical protein